MSAPTSRQRRRRALAHQCPECRRHWALRLVEHPSGPVLVCRACSAVRRTGLSTGTPQSSGPGASTG